jgi:hypothetical protein
LELLADQSKEGDKNRDLLNYSIMLNFDKVDYSSLNDLDYTLSLINNFFVDENGNYANYHIPMLSDSPVAASIQFKRYTNSNTPKRGLENISYEEFLLDKFVDIAKQEIQRIQLVK